MQHFTRLSASRPRLRRGAPQRLAIGFLALTLAVTAGLPAIAGDPHRDGRQDDSRQAHGVTTEAKRGDKKTVRKSFSSGGAIAVPVAGAPNQTGPADPYPSTIRVRGFKKTRIVDVNLTLRSISHGASQDLDVMLVAPGGRNAIVMSDVGSGLAQESQVSNITVALDDEAANPLPLGTGHPLTAGLFQPRNPPFGLDVFPTPAPTLSDNVALSTFDGIGPNGTWRLFIDDDQTLAVGSIADGWTLEITARSKKRRR